MSSRLGLKGLEITTRFDLDAVRNVEMWESNDSGGEQSRDISMERVEMLLKRHLGYFNFSFTFCLLRNRHLLGEGKGDRFSESISIIARFQIMRKS
jgi:hypothetical protein